MRLLVPWLVLAVVPSASPLAAENRKLTFEERVEMVRGLMAEYATAKTFLPRSKKPLLFESNGTYDKQQWEAAGRRFGPAARTGDLVQITRVIIEDDKILFEINGGVKGKRWYERIEVGVGSQTGPIAAQNSNAPGGTKLALLFHKPVPPMKVADLKKILAPVLDFEKRSATENYMDSLPPETQKAIKEKKAIEGMDKEQVLLALGRPRHKSREFKDGMELEDWVYGYPPGRIIFVTFNANKVIRVKEAYAGLGGEVREPLPPR